MSRTVDNLLTLAQVDEGRLRAADRARSRLREAVDAAVRPLQPARRRAPASGSTSARRAEDDGRRARRPAAPAPGAHEPARERDQVHAAGRRGRGQGVGAVAARPA